MVQLSQNESVALHMNPKTPFSAPGLVAHGVRYMTCVPDQGKDLGPPKRPNEKSTLAFPIMMISPWPSPTKREGLNGAI